MKHSKKTTLDTSINELLTSLGDKVEERLRLILHEAIADGFDKAFSKPFPVAKRG